MAEIMIPAGRQEKSAMRKMFIRMTCLLACDILKREKRRRVLYKFKGKNSTTSKDGLSMQIENEIEYAARKIISSNYQIGLTQEELDDAVNRAKESLKTDDLDFSRLESLVLTQDGHTRRVYRYSDMLAPENVICQCL